MTNTKTKLTPRHIILRKKGQALQKSELALLYGVPTKTISRYLNEQDFEYLNKEFGYKKNNIYVSPQIVNYYYHGWLDNFEIE